MKVITVCSGKGGVGKTFTAQSLAVEHTQKNKNSRCLLIDSDPSQNTSVRMIRNLEDLDNGITLSNLYSNKNAYIHDAIYGCTDEFPNIDIIPSSEEMEEIDKLLSGRKNVERILKRLISQLNGKYDLVIIDCPPNRSTLVVNALVACDGFITPFAMDTASIDGVMAIYSLIDLLEEEGILTKSPKDLGSFPVGYDYPNSRGTKEVMNAAEKHLKKSLLRFKVPRTTHVREAIAANTTLQFQRDHKVSLEYQSIHKYITKEMNLGV